MSDLIAFLKARLDEDEAWLNSFTPDQAEACQPFTIGRQCEEIAAKRAIVDHWGWLDADYDYGTFPAATIAALAAVYSNHPDYRQEWAA